MRIEKLIGYGKYVGIAGHRNVEIRNVERFLEKIREKTDNATIQFLNADLVAGWEHLFFAVLNALTAFKNRRNFANSLAVEILLFASAQRQIKHALELLGIKPETSKIAVVIVENEHEKTLEIARKISEILQALEDDSVLEVNGEKFDRIRQAFDIGAEELKSRLRGGEAENEALVELVIEHVALLATQR